MMKRKSHKANLARGLELLMLALQVVNALLDILSKVVNYEWTVRKLRLSI
jgi:hypothetical protein